MARILHTKSNSLKPVLGLQRLRHGSGCLELTLVPLRDITNRLGGEPRVLAGSTLVVGEGNMLIFMGSKSNMNVWNLTIEKGQQQPWERRPRV